MAVVEPTPTATTAAGAGVVTGSGDDGSGGGGGGSAFKLPDLGIVTGASPIFAWLIATAGGILLFMFLMRRSEQGR